MLVNICMKFHEGILNVFWVTEQTWPYHRIYYFQFQRAIAPKIHNPGLQFLRSARHLMFLYICVKFHVNISNGFWVTEWTQFCDRQTDGWTDDPGKNNMSPNPKGGRHERGPGPLLTRRVQGTCPGKFLISRMSEKQPEALLRSFTNNNLHRNGSFFIFLHDIFCLSS